MTPLGVGAPLLRGSATELVAAVTNALELFGFEASDRDTINPPNDRLEDLRVSIPGDSDWVALAEVRGYAKGAVQGDLLRLSGRFAKRYILDEGKPPTRLWYVVNQFLGDDPGSRPPALAGNEPEIQVFSEEGGVVIDTVQLFKAVRDIESGRASSDAVFDSLLSASGRWEWNAPD